MGHNSSMEHSVTKVCQLLNVTQPFFLIPSFTPCFSNTVLTYLPTFLLLLLLPVDLIILSKSAARDVSLQ